MTESNDWARRVDQITAATAAEQLRTVVRDAQETLRSFITSAYEQGSLVLDAQRETEVAVAGKIDQLSTDIRAQMDAIAARIAAIEAAQKAMSEFLAAVFEVPGTASPITAVS